MAKKIIEISVDESLAENAQNIYKKLGLDLDDAIKLFLNQTLLSNGLPFSLRLSPIEQTKEPPLIPAPESADTPSGQSEPELSPSHQPAPAPESAPSGLSEQESNPSEQSSSESADTPSGQSEQESNPSDQPAPAPESADMPSRQSEQESNPSHQPAPEKTSIVDDEEENTDAPNHLFDGWNK